MTEIRSAFHYLDFAATAAVRPPQVAQAVHTFLTEVGATPGRGGHSLAVEAGRLSLQCRKAVTRILGVPEDPTRVVFGQNATQAINMALYGLLGPGDVVVTTAFDHNAVLRPVHRLVAERGVAERMVPGQPDGSLDLQATAEALDGARLLVVNVVSNVLGTLLPVGKLAQMAHEAGALVLVDAAQWAGHYTDSMEAQGADLVAFTGHKGLLGPQGIGGLWIREGVEPGPFLSGGTGGNSESRDMPASLPGRMEAGSANAPGMAGLLAGIGFLENEGIDLLHRRELELKARLWDGLDSLQGIRVLSPPAPDGVGIVTVVSEKVDPSSLARELDRDWGVMVRHGLNCAPEIHKMLGTTEGGAVRLSVGWATSMEDVDQAVRGIEAITRGHTSPSPETWIPCDFS
jgi:selenocysteine lyase/cysteine desulfurase